jgi:hypothetical protein
VSIDRIAPTRRPAGAVRGYQRWRSLLFLHWPVPVEALRPLVPPALDIDTHEGTAYVGLVPFAMQGVRPRWAPEALSFDFLETNVRTYVHAGGRDPGVYFFSLDAASRIAVTLARAGWGLPYFYSAMQLERDGEEVRYSLSRRSGDRPRLEVRYRIGEPLGPSEPGSLRFFLVERYFLHVERGGAIWSGQVHHTPYPVESAKLLSLDEQLVAATGLPAPDGPPPLVHYAEGVDVDIYALARRPRAEA